MHHTYVVADRSVCFRERENVTTTTTTTRSVQCRSCDIVLDCNRLRLENERAASGPTKIPKALIELVTVCGGSFFACEDFESSFDHSFPACTFFLLFFKVDVTSHKLIPIFRRESVHSGLASWGDCGRVFPNKLRVSSFPCVWNSQTASYWWTGQKLAPSPVEGIVWPFNESFLPFIVLRS